MIVGFVNYLRWGHDPIERRSGVWLGEVLMDSLILFERQMETMARGGLCPALLMVQLWSCLEGLHIFQPQGVGLDYLYVCFKSS